MLVKFIEITFHPNQNDHYLKKNISCQDVKKNKPLYTDIKT
jgi:hypothetical protein